ncbi:glycoside hydrolase family 32 protein [Acutalibacter caecimuris]|uniref:glycoside hydrolase family 32 protein n=1 Tax=Acutalibacter caecimuris TaxID=3093657 RepID=UPI002AC9D20D|nr:glycoside hydrolase family 32 protein [Acutalibacter sp. M00118]
MHTEEGRDFRPALHFTPRAGWINDPNGLVFVDGTYHLFAQYYPEPDWGPMHWCHGSSRDLIHWEHLPVALEPDGLGYIFSGSAVYDRENTSGLGEGGRGPLVALYTSHLPGEGGRDREQQSLAYSLDGIRFTKYQGNPVLPGSRRDCRDPKVFRNPVRGCWSMVLAAGDHVEFYASEDLKKWEKTGEFGPAGNYAKGVWECPDLFPLQAGGEEVWVLLVSMGPSEENHGARTQYFTGRFDGDSFRCDGRFTQPEFIDAGLDNYAGVTFFGTEERLLVGWACNWIYAHNTPTGAYRGQMTLPRRLFLADTPKGGLRLGCAPVDQAAFGEAGPWTGELSGQVFKLTVTGTGAGAVRLSNRAGQCLDFGVDAENRAFFDRSQAGEQGFDENFARDWYSRMAAPRFYEGGWEMQFLFDRSVAEMFVDQGTRAFTWVVYPSQPYDRLTVSGSAQVRLHAMQPG